MSVFNPFRIAADLVHVLSIYFLLTKIISHRNCLGISLKSQILFALVWATRYLDLFSNFFSLYNTVLKIIYLATSAFTIFLILRRFRATYDRVHDTFPIWTLIVPCIPLALLFTANYHPVEICWTFSIFLEVVAIVPQIALLRKTGEVENLNSRYIFCLGLYRALYIVNWVYRYATESNYFIPLVWVCGTIQTVLYADYFYYYIKSRLTGTKMYLP